RVWALPILSLGHVSFNEWHHLALRYDKTRSQLDGLLDGVVSPTAVFGDRSTPYEAGLHLLLAFGLGEPTHLGSGAFYDGQLDEIRVWNVFRTDSEIQANMYRELLGAEPGLVGYWQFDA